MGWRRGVRWVGGVEKGVRWVGGVEKGVRWVGGVEKGGWMGRWGGEGGLDG